MSYINEEIMLTKVITDFFHILEEGDQEKFLQIWHPKARRFTIGNTLQVYVFDGNEMIKYSLQGVKNLKQQNPGQEMVKFQLEEIIKIQIFENVIAAAELKWYTLFANSKGVHHTFIHFVKQNDRWYIANILDRGFEGEF